MIVNDLTPGDIVDNGITSATFIERTTHPIWPALMLVVWRMPDGSWSLDAFSARQDVGDVANGDESRDNRLRRAMVGGDAYGGFKR